MPDRGTTAFALARLAAELRGTSDERGRALLDESLALASELENVTDQIDVAECLAPAMRAAGDPRVDAFLGRLEGLARATDGRERVLALGRLGVVLASVGNRAPADELIREAFRLAQPLKNNGDYMLIADIGLFGIRIPGEPAAQTNTQ